MLSRILPSKNDKAQTWLVPFITRNLTNLFLDSEQTSRQTHSFRFASESSHLLVLKATLPSYLRSKIEKWASAVKCMNDMFSEMILEIRIWSIDYYAELLLTRRCLTSFSSCSWVTLAIFLRRSVTTNKIKMALNASLTWTKGATGDHLNSQNDAT